MFNWVLVFEASLGRQGAYFYAYCLLSKLSIPFCFFFAFYSLGPAKF